MKSIFGGALVAVALAHAWHIVQIEPGSVTNLNAGRALAFASLDRLASIGIIGKLLVLALDSAVLVWGLSLLFRGQKK